MAVAGTAELESRPPLPWLYVAILLVEVFGLGGLAVTSPGAPPWTYELGWAGCGSMLIMQLYSVRRRVRALRALGSLRGWLDAHIFLGLQGFVLVAYHSIGISLNPSLATFNFALVSAVVVTGIIGRYFYSVISQVRADDLLAHAELGATVLRGLAPPPARPRACRGVVDLVRLDLARRRALRQLLRDPALSPEQVRAARRSILLASRISALDVAELWFSRWTLVHRPLAILLLAITSLHVLAHFAYAA